MGRLSRGVFASGVAAVGLLAAGCASPNYTYGRFRSATPDDVPPAIIEQGTPHKTLDRLARVFEAPTRLLPADRRPQRGLSPETAETLAEYLQKNDLTDVPIYVTHYDPGGQWRRLRENTEMSPLWRYTAGAWSVLAYTLVPDRVFGKNRYNPYTNSLYVNSDQPIALLHEAAVAKDVRTKRFPGAYAVLTSVPGLALVRQVRAANDVLSYARAEGDWDTERQAYRVLYPRVGMEGTTAAMPVASFVSVMAWWARPLIGLGVSTAGSWIGGVVGDTVATRRAAEVRESPAGPPPPATGDSTQTDGAN